MQESYLNSPVMYSVALTLIHFIWQGCLVALALKFVLLAIPRRSSQLRYSFSTLAMVLNLVLPIITFFIIYKPTYLQLTQSLSNTNISDLNLASLASTQHAWYSTTFEYLPYVTVLWLAVIGILSLKLIAELYSVNQLPHKGAADADQELMSRFQSLASQIGLKKAPKLLLSFVTEVPMAIGWLRPVVLIPVSMLSGLTPAQLDMLILHELAHVRRHDYLVNFIQTLVEIVLFFHPAVLWVSNQMRNEREYCSDDIAVHHCGNPIAYAHTLADTASICNKHRKHSIPSMAMAASGGDLTQRVMRLVNEPHCSSQNNVSKWFASLCVLSLVLFISSHQLLKLTNVDINTSQFTFNDHYDVRDNRPDSLINGISKKLQQAKVEVLLVPMPSATNNKISSPISLTNIDSEISNDVISDINNPTPVVQLPIVNQASEQVKEITAISKDTAQSYSNEINDDELAKPMINKITSSKALITVTPKNKSIVEKAFAKTDSTLKTSSNNNKYANEIATFSSDLPVDNNIPQIKSRISLAPQNVLISSIQEPVKTSAKLVFSVAPKYPSIAKRKGIELEVKVDFIIDAMGNISDITFHSKNKINYFRTAVRSAIEKWKFEPAKYNGQAVESKMSKIFSFSLER